tara:strand:+ start:86 stop:457 length:372 start_codon:yes stop_codon:yes gene_type:complete
MIMETVKIGALTYKLGLHNKYYYLASSGEWLKASEQSKIKQEFGLIKNQTKEMSAAAKTRLMILDVMKDSKPKTRREFAEILDISKILAKHRFMELIKSGEVMVSGMGRCSIIKRTVPVYKLV